ncbi:MAG: hypothetical protein K8F91_02350 [Candidatus Obscuribacterales bacterium]|nr:hypothetical protein [Candidatus Obscuribacterales bacterium]
MVKQKIFLVFSDTGAGHRTAAEAIKRAILEVSNDRQSSESVEIVMRDVIEESNSLNALFEHTYNRLLKKHQDWMKYYFTLIEWVKPNESEIGYRLLSDYAKKMILETDPSIIVSVHPMVNHFLARTLKELGLAEKIKLFTVLTDPNANLWSGWACTDVSLTIAPNDIARDRLIAFGLSPDRIKVIGMPILPDFLKPPVESREALLLRLGLDPVVATIAITAGSAGGGNMLKIYKALAPVKKKIQVVFFCGNNAKLKLKAEQASRDMPFTTVVLPYAESMLDSMDACDLLVTKAGGLITFEAIARRLPMALDMVTKPMPQESGTAEMLMAAGLACSIKKPADILPIVEGLEIVANRLETPLPTLHNLDKVDAVYEIARIILDSLEPDSLNL